MWAAVGNLFQGLGLGLGSLFEKCCHILMVFESNGSYIYTDFQL